MIEDLTPNEIEGPYNMINGSITRMIPLPHKMTELGNEVIKTNGMSKKTRHGWKSCAAT
ncbi:hypothetical protein PMm318_A27870 [Pseudomonas moorei]